MIRQIRGTVVEKEVGSAVIDVSGVGYLVAIPRMGELEAGAEVILHTHLAVRENAMDLYGFVAKDELEMFEMLLTIPKIGPKSALQIMSQADVTLLKTAVLSEDPTYLTKMSGIGKKSAEKIVTELKHKFDESEAAVVGDNSERGDTVDALIALGYTQKEARDAVQKLPPELEDTNARIKEALKQLGT